MAGNRPQQLVAEAAFGSFSFDDPSMQDVALDALILGPTAAAGNYFPIHKFDVNIVPGEKPSVCPNTDRPLPPAFIPDVLKVFKRLNLIPAGRTIHWVGSQLNLENVCTCYRSDNSPVSEPALLNQPVVARNGGTARRELEAPSAPIDSGNRAANREPRVMWLARALLLVQKNPDWSNARIAKQVGIHASQLTRSKAYQFAAATARGDKSALFRGFQKIEADTNSRDLEAVAPTTVPTDDKSERGQQIPGSKYYREYCNECGEPIKVKMDAVGTNPICEDCRT